MPDQKRYLSRNEVINLLGISETTLWRWIRDGLFPKPVKFGLRRIFFKTADVEAFLLASEGKDETLHAL